MSQFKTTLKKLQAKGNGKFLKLGTILTLVNYFGGLLLFYQGFSGVYKFSKLINLKDDCYDLSNAKF